MRTLLGLSGGLDSTYALWKLLTETEDQVIGVCFDHNDLDENKILKSNYTGFSRITTTEEHKKRKELVIKIYEWMYSNVRPFTLLTPKFDPEKLSNSKYPINPQMYIVDYSIELINNNQLDRVVIATEKENDGFSQNKSNNSLRLPGGFIARNKFIKEAKRGEINFLLLDLDYHQGNALSEMPQELINLTRSCDEPDSPCGKCFKCSKRKFFLNMIAQNKTMKEISDYIESKSVTSDGRWISMKFWLYDEINTYQYYISSTGKPPIEYWSMRKWPTSYKVQDEIYR